MQTPKTDAVQVVANPERSRRVLIVLYVSAVALYWASLYFYVPTLPVYVKLKVDFPHRGGHHPFDVRSLAGPDTPAFRHRHRLGRLAQTFHPRGFYPIGRRRMGDGDRGSGAGLGVGRAITGLAAGTWVPLTVIFSSLFPPQEAVRATAILTAVNSLSRMAASGTNGWLNGLGGYSLPFFVAIAIAMVAILVVLPAREERIPPVKPSIGTIRALVTRPDVFRPAVLSALAQYVTWSATLSFTPILAHNLGASDNLQSLLTSGSIGIITIGNLVTVTLEKKMGNANLARISFAMLALGAILAALSPNLAWLFVAQFFASVGSGISQPLLMGMSIAKVEGNQRATAMGLHQAVYGVGMFAGPFLSGALADWLGIQPMFGVTGFACLVLGFLGVKWMASRR